MTIITEDDFIQSIEDGLQFISYYHPADYIRHLSAAYHSEQGPSAKEAMAQILTNARMAALGHRPMCQDTGVVNVFVKVGMQTRLAFSRSIEELVNEATRRAYMSSENPLRATMVLDPLFGRTNSGDNTPAVVHTSLVPGDGITINLMAKGGGSENKARFATLNPSDDIVEWVVNTVETLGAGWCPPGIIGIGVGGSADMAMRMAKETLYLPIDMDELLRRGPNSNEEEIRIKIYNGINALGIGAQGLGGMTTVVDVKLKTHPTHAASNPVGLIPQCAAVRHITFRLTGEGPAVFNPPDLGDWPDIALQRTDVNFRRVNLDGLTKAEVATFKIGEKLLLSGKLLTGRDAAHKRIADMHARGEELPVEFANRVIYYVGPVDPVGDEAVGPAGPTTSSRMDKFTDLMLGDLGLIAMIGKAERGQDALDSIAKHKSAYLVAVGGAAILVSQAIKKSKVVAFSDLGMEAIHEFTIQDMPVTVAADAHGQSIHMLGPAEWKSKLSKTP